MNNCRDNRFIQNICNTPGVSCQYRTSQVQTERCGNATRYTEVVQVSTPQGVAPTNPNLVNIGFNPTCQRVVRRQNL